MSEKFGENPGNNKQQKNTEKPSVLSQINNHKNKYQDNRDAQNLKEKQLQEIKKLSNNQEKENIITETKEKLDKELIVNSAKILIYENLGINEQQENNNILQNFSKGVIDGLIIGNVDLAIEIINTNGKIILDSLKQMFTWEGLKNIAKSLGESVIKIFSGNAYEKGKNIAELGLITTGVGVGFTIGKKGLKIGMKQIIKATVNKENLVKSVEVKNVIKQTNNEIKNIIPKQTINFEKALLSDIAKLGNEERILAGKFYLGDKKLTNIQENAIITAHEVGQDRIGAGIGNYNLAELKQKYKILKDAGFEEKEIRTLMEKGVCGKIPEPVKDLDAGFKGSDILDNKIKFEKLEDIDSGMIRNLNYIKKIKSEMQEGFKEISEKLIKMKSLEGDPKFKENLGEYKLGYKNKNSIQKEHYDLKAEVFFKRRELTGLQKNINNLRQNSINVHLNASKETIAVKLDKYLDFDYTKEDINRSINIKAELQLLENFTGKYKVGIKKLPIKEINSYRAYVEGVNNKLDNIMKKYEELEDYNNEILENLKNSSDLIQQIEKNIK